MSENTAQTLHRSKDDPEAFVDFYRAHFDRILAFLARRCLDEQVALDLTAESFAQAYAARHGFRGDSPQEAEAWIFRIARRQLSRYQRKGKLERKAMTRLGIEVPQLDDDQRGRIEDLADLAGLRGALRAELVRISPLQRVALQLRIVDELSSAEVAAKLRISEEAARLRVSRGLRALADALEDNPTVKELRS